MIENSRDEDVCRAWDVLADEDHTYHTSEEEYFYYKNNWWISLNKSGNDTQPLRKRSDFKQALSTLKRLHQEAGGDNSSPFSTGSTNNGNQHRVLPLPGGNGKNPGSLPKNSQKVKKREASKGLWSIGATRCLQNFGENLRRKAFKNSFYFVTARSFTAEGGLLHPTGGVKTTPQKTRFRDVKYARFVIQIELTMTGQNRTTTSRRKELCTWKIEYAWWNEVDVSNLLAERWDVRHQWQRENQDQHKAHETRQWRDTLG